MQTVFGWTEDYEDNMRMRPYPVFELERVQKRTILVSAKKGVGKSKAFMKWLVEMVKKNPEVFRSDRSQYLPLLQVLPGSC
jgi:hypothetical protein